MNYILDIESQIRRIFSNNKFLGENMQMQDFIQDLYDGAIYKKFYNQKKNSFILKECFSFSLNADGIKVCDKSNLSIWPIILVINELPLKERYCIENCIIAGKKDVFQNFIYIFII